MARSLPCFTLLCQWPVPATGTYGLDEPESVIKLKDVSLLNQGRCFDAIAKVRVSLCDKIVDASCREAMRLRKRDVLARHLH